MCMCLFRFSRCHTPEDGVLCFGDDHHHNDDDNEDDGGKDDDDDGDMHLPS